MTARRAAHRRCVRLGDAGLLIATPLCAMIPIVSCGVRAAIDPLTSGHTPSKRIGRTALLYGNSSVGLGAYSHLLGPDKRVFRLSKMTGLSGSDTAQALTI